LPLIKEKGKQKMNPGLIKLIIQAVEAVCVLVVTAVTIRDSVKKNKEQKK